MAEKFSPTAKVVDGILILSLPDAMSPVVWQMEIGQSKSSALEVRPENDSEFALVLKTPRQDVLEIARYNKRDNAVRALITVSSALEKAQGQLRLAANSDAPKHAQRSAYDYSVPALRNQMDGQSADSKLKNYLFKPVAYISSALVLFALLFLVTSSMFGLFTGAGNGPVMSGATDKAETRNTPVSAEDFLEGR